MTPVSFISILIFNDLTRLQVGGRAARGDVPAGTPSPAPLAMDRTPRQSIPEVLTAGLELELELEQVTDVDPLASPTTELGTTAAANNPLASPDLSLPAPSWVLARPRDSGFPVPAGLVWWGGVKVCVGPARYRAVCPIHVSLPYRWRSGPVQARSP